MKENTYTLPMPLLDFVAQKIECAYLSDLHYLNDMQRNRLAHLLEQIPAESASLHDWNDALEYLTGQPPEKTAEKARTERIRCLMR